MGEGVGVVGGRVISVSSSRALALGEASFVHSSLRLPRPSCALLALARLPLSFTHNTNSSMTSTLVSHTHGKGLVGTVVQCRAKILRSPRSRSTRGHLTQSALATTSVSS